MTDEKQHGYMSRRERDLAALKESYLKLIDFARTQAASGRLTEREAQSIPGMFHLGISAHRGVEPPFPDDEIIPRGQILARLNETPDLSFGNLTASQEDITLVRNSLAAVAAMLEHWLPEEKQAIAAAMKSGASRA